MTEALTLAGMLTFLGGLPVFLDLVTRPRR